MAIYKCKMCGGDIHPQEGTRLITCEYCGTTQTVCQIDDSRIANLFNRANEQRINNEFDKAEALYESIINENPQEAEAYWGKLLCKYGIEYVDDPLTGKKIPTCHRTIYDSIYDDPDYQRAINNSDSVAEKQYHEEAKEIDRLQKKILEVAAKEDPYDVFICYKETDDAGERTKDSVYAEDLYNALTDKGYRVFFSRITLESKLGTEYEPVIFAALQSAKVMLVVGTKYDYLNSVWVKNEWKRYFELVKNEKSSKMIIPCYADMDPTDLPKEFSMLQGQDLTKIGAVQDIVRGVQKIIDSNGERVDVSTQALTLLLNEREKKQIIKNRIKKICLVVIPIIVLIVLISVLFLFLKNMSNTPKAYKVIEVEEGIPDCEKYDVFHVKVTKDNIDDYFDFCKVSLKPEKDAFGNQAESKYEAIGLRSLAYEKGWYMIFKTDYEGKEEKISQFSIQVQSSTGNKQVLNELNWLLDYKEKSWADGFYGYFGDYDKGTVDFTDATGEIWFISKNDVAVQYAYQDMKDTDNDFDEGCKIDYQEESERIMQYLNIPISEKNPVYYRVPVRMFDADGSTHYMENSKY